MARHIASHQAKDEQAALIQTRIGFNSDNEVRNFVYNQEQQRIGLGKLIASNDLPLGFGSSPAFVEYIKKFHTPTFTAVSRQTTSRDLKKMCKESLKQIKDDFTTCTFSVSLTSDIWSGRAKQDYISVVAHYVNEDWEILKRIIGFELIDVKHTGDNIAEAIIKVVENFGLTNKIFAVTLDNASSNTSAMNTLGPVFGTYATSFLLHQRCACHIINLIAKTVLKNLKPHLKKLRIAISFMNSSNGRLSEYQTYCTAWGKPHHKFSLDMKIRWNSTYLMINSLLGDKDQFSSFVNQKYRTDNGQPLLTEETWHIISVLHEFLELFYNSTIQLSGVYYPTSPLMVHHIVSIARHLKSWEDDPILTEAISKMKMKYLKYWSEIPILYAFAFILDPMAKLDGLRAALDVLGQTVGIDYSDYFTNVRDKLSEVFHKYELKYNTVRVQRPPVAPSRTKTTKVWNIIFGPSSSASASTTSTPVVLGSGELAKYLNCDIVPHGDSEDFNILQWWNAHKLTYPMLSILAKDVLSVPVSTVSSESAFSLAGRILDERRTSLTPNMVRTLMTVKDGELAKRRAQHTTCNEELVAAFEHVGIDDEEE
jgi:hypothetical protein